MSVVTTDKVVIFIRAEDINNIESEAGIIATLIHYPNFYFYAEQLLPNHFFAKTNRIIYTAITDLAKKGISDIDAYNILSDLDASDSTKRYAEEISIDQLQELIDMSSTLCRNTAEEYKMLVGNVMDAAFRRNTFAKLRDCQAFCFDQSATDIQRKIYSTLDEVMMDFSAASDIPLYSDVVGDMWKEIEARQRGEISSSEFPFEALNEYVLMEPGEVVCFTGGPKSGKSAMLLTCTVDLLKKGKSVLYIDSEISTRLFTTRLLAHLTGIRFSDLRSGNYTQEEADIIQECIEWLKTRKLIHVYLPVFDENAMYLAAVKAKHLIDVDVVVLDYLKSTSGEDDAFATYSALGRISETLKNRICGDLGVAGLTAAQATSTGKIADSARIARTVSTVIAIQEKTLEEIEADGTGATKKLKVVYNRNGSQMVEGEYIDLIFDGSHCKYTQAPKQHIKEEPY